MRKPSVKDWLTDPLDSLLGLDMDELENKTRKRVYRQDVSWEVFKLAHKHYREELETTKDTRLLRREAQRIFDHINSITDRTELYKKMDQPSL